MAKGFNKTGLDVLGWEIFRGTGRQTGRSISKGLEKQLKKKVLNDQSAHRKYVERFTLPGTFKTAKNKMFTLIDSFFNEYVTTKAYLQAAIYLKEDIEFIERKLDFLTRLIDTEAEERAFDRLLSTWVEYKEEAIKHK